MNYNMNIFKSYDIRGKYPNELNEGIAYLIGRAFAEHIGAEKVVLGRDARQSSKAIHKALIKGLTDQGMNVIDIGESSTPLFYFSASKFPAGLMITASHLGPEYNGIKLCREKAIPIGLGSGLGAIKNTVLRSKFSTPYHKGSVKRGSFLNEYIKFSKQFLKGIPKGLSKKKINIVLDTGNGMSSLVFSRVKIPGVNIVPLFWDIDCSFPNHPANPAIESSLKKLREAVINKNADFGIAFDGDGDRCRFVDNLGAVVDVSHSSALLLSDIGIEGYKVVFDVSSSRVLRDEIKRLGGIPVEYRVGHAHIKRKMRDIDAIFGSEDSGHIYHKLSINNESFYFENELIPLFRMINILRQSPDSTVSSLLSRFRTFHKIPEKNIRFMGDYDKLISSIKKQFNPDQGFLFIDGLKARSGDWWFSLRPSNTEPVLRLNIEAKTKSILKDIKQKLLLLIEKYNI